MERPTCECLACRIEWLWENDELKNTEKIDLKDFAATIRAMEDRTPTESDIRPSQEESQAVRKFRDR